MYVVMANTSTVAFICDRGGHLHNALQLRAQFGTPPDFLITTDGPDVDELVRNQRLSPTAVFTVPVIFTWMGKHRFFNLLKGAWHLFACWRLVHRLRPSAVVSVGATDVLAFCYLARLYGARIYHVECMNQVVHSSITARLLMPICEKIYTQWEELLPQLGPKATYAGWVL